MKLNRLLFLASLSILLGLSWPFSLIGQSNPEVFGTSTWLEKEVRIIKSQSSNLNEQVVRLSLKAYLNARKRGLDNKELLTIIDYSQPSTEKHLWVIDLRNNRLLFNTWVSHGKNSGNLNATSFSNANGSLKSSVGVFTTDTRPYVGGRGLALRLRGLERGINDNAYSRNIVIHGAPYVNADIIKSYGQVGRSWGCPAVSLDLIKPIIEKIKENTLVVAYYPDRHWLSRSQFLVG